MCKHTRTLLWTKERLRLSGLSAVTILVTIFYTSFINIYQHLSIFYMIFWPVPVTNTITKLHTKPIHKTLFQIWSKSCPYFAHFMCHILPIFCKNIDMVQFCPFYDQFMVHILPILWPIYGPYFAHSLSNNICFPYLDQNRTNLWTKICPNFDPFILWEK